MAGSGSKMEAGQDFSQDALQRAVSAIHRQAGVTPWRARQARAAGTSALDRVVNLHNLGRVPEGLPERGRGSAAQTGLAITEKTQAHESPVIPRRAKRQPPVAAGGEDSKMRLLSPSPGELNRLARGVGSDGDTKRGE